MSNWVEWCGRCIEVFSFYLCFWNLTLASQVVISWIQNEEISSDDFIYGKGYRLLNGLFSSKDIHKLFPLQLNELCSVQTNDVEVFIKGVQFWHAAMIRDLYQIIEELYQIRSSNSFASLPPVIVQLKFIADILVFYRLPPTMIN